MSNEARDYDNDIRESIKDICRCKEVCPGEDYVLIEKELCVVKCLLDACQISSTELTEMTITAVEWEEKCKGLEEKYERLERQLGLYKRAFEELDEEKEE